MTPVDHVSVEQRLVREHEETTRLVTALSKELDEIIESVAHSNNDDEHDPDGATNGYERAKATAMLRHAQQQLLDIDGTLDRLRRGIYGRCERCGGDIGTDRLDALPTTTRCVACAAIAPAG